jgi:2-oxoglutarate ferredoxin oxidoreductase subunit gamma
MQTEIIISGFGGQGVLFAGQLLSYAAMDNGMQVTWIPSYGPEMRGGTANCTVIIADEEIGAPMVARPAASMALNRPSLDKYEPLVKPGGVLVVNASMVDRAPSRSDIKVIMIPASEIAERVGDRRLTNMVMLGALLANLGVLPVEALERAIQHHTPARHMRFVPLNLQAIREGATYLAKSIIPSPN